MDASGLRFSFRQQRPERPPHRWGDLVHTESTASFWQCYGSAEYVRLGGSPKHTVYLTRELLVCAVQLVFLLGVPEHFGLRRSTHLYSRPGSIIGSHDRHPPNG